MQYEPGDMMNHWKIVEYGMKGQIKWNRMELYFKCGIIIPNMWKKKKTFSKPPTSNSIAYFPEEVLQYKLNFQSEQSSLVGSCDLRMSGGNCQLASSSKIRIKKCLLIPVTITHTPTRVCIYIYFSIYIYNYIYI